MKLVGFCCILFLILLLQIHSSTPKLFQEEEILVSITIDVDHEEVLREGIRLFLSLIQFGTKIKGSVIDICLIEKHGSLQKVEKIISFLTLFSNNFRSVNIRAIRDPEFYPSRRYSQTINKMCSFEAASIYKHQTILKYFLYLDADLVILQDPIEFLESQSEFERGQNLKQIHCSRPWNTFSALNYLIPFVFYEDHPYSSAFKQKQKNSFIRALFENEDLRPTSVNNPDYPFLKTISPGGHSLHSLCNTGFYFMPIDYAEQLYEDSLYYLSILPSFRSSYSPAEEEKENFLSFYNPLHSMIDSIILWAGIVYRDYSVRILPIEMNLIVSASNFLIPFMTPKQESASPKLDNNLSGTDEYLNMNALLFEKPVILHFSKGSDLLFTIQEDGRCVTRFLGSWSHEINAKALEENPTEYEGSLFANLFQQYFRYQFDEAVCAWFAVNIDHLLNDVKEL